jgi:hypothetical protein
MLVHLPPELDEFNLHRFHVLGRLGLTDPGRHFGSFQIPLGRSLELLF